MSSDLPVVRVYRMLLHLYPRRFRTDYGNDMVQLVSDQCQDDPSWRVGARAALDMAITIPIQHLEAHMNRPSTHLVPLLYTAIAAGGLLSAIIAGSNGAMVAIGLCIAVIAGVTAAIAWRRSGPVRDSVSTDVWWKLVLVGPCILASVIIAAGLGVDAWMLGMFAVFVAFVATATGVLLGIARLTRRHSRTVPT